MRHHEETIELYAANELARPSTLGLILVGSVARGDERPDSDVDVYQVLTEDAYAAAVQAGQVAYVSTVVATYPGGYVDVKLASLGYLRAAADHGDDPTRASFAASRVVADRSGELAALARRIVDLPEAAWAARVRSYRAQLALHGGYFLGQAYARGDRFLLRHSAVHAALAAGRCALAQQHRLFRGQKYLAGDLARLEQLPAAFLPAWEQTLDAPTPLAVRSLTDVVDRWLGDPLSTDDALSTFILDNELGWLHRTIPPEYW